MSRLFFSTFALSLFVSPLLGQKSHLLVYSQGNGAIAIFGSEKREVLKKANFVPKNTTISVRPKSGIETISAGFQFRFGAESKFEFGDKGINLIDGSIMIRSRNVFNKANIHTPKANVEISGSGTALIKAEQNGGAKLVGVLGKLSFLCKNSGSTSLLLPGSLIFLKPNGVGFSDVLNVDLLNLVNTSYLIQGFPNSDSLQKSLESTALAQAEMVISEVGAYVGNAKQADSFEILPADSGSVKQSKSANSFRNDPLTELLGRNPKKVIDRDYILDEEEPISLPAIDLPEPVPPSRPFPSRLLRSSN
jgi:hypothetical protein